MRRITIRMRMRSRGVPHREVTSTRSVIPIHHRRTRSIVATVCRNASLFVRRVARGVTRCAPADGDDYGVRRCGDCYHRDPILASAAFKRRTGVYCTAGSDRDGRRHAAWSHAGSDEPDPARERYLEETVDPAEWEARWPRRWRRVTGGIAIVAFTASTIGILAASVFDSEWGWRLDCLLFVGVVLVNTQHPRTFRVTDAGLVIEHPLQRQFRQWSAYTNFELTDDALVIRPAAWWRPTHRCDRAEVVDH